LDVLLIHPPSILDAEKSKKSIMESKLIGYGMLSIGSLLKKEGYNVEVLNIPFAYSLGFSKENIFSIIRDYRPKLVGIELNWIQFSKGAIDCARKIKDLFPNTPIVIGGVHATVFASEILKIYPFIDAIFVGEAELTFLEYLNELENNKNFSEIKGIFRIDENGKICDQGHAKVFENIDEIPPYSVDIIKPKLIPPFDLGMINTCRGPCVNQCVYCMGNRKTYSNSFRTRRKRLVTHSPKWIRSQIRLLLHDVRKISIQDYIYCRPKLVLEIAKELQRFNLEEKIEYFNFAALPGTLNKETLIALSKAGVDNIDLGIETGSNHILKVLKRPYTTSIVEDTIKSTVRSGILPKTYWMVGFPFETEEEINHTKDLILKTVKLGGIPKWVTPLCLFPGLDLYENAKEYGLKLKLNNFQDFFSFSTTKRNINSWYPSAITHETQHFTVDDILKKSLELKRFISSKKELIFKIQKKFLKYYVKFHPKLKENDLINRFKLILDLLKYSFF